MKKVEDVKDALKRCLRLSESQCEGCPYSLEEGRCTRELMQDVMQLIGIPTVKKYTAFDVIGLVQEAVSEEICGLDDGGMLVAYEVERGIIGKLVKEDGCETNV